VAAAGESKAGVGAAIAVSANDETVRAVIDDTVLNAGGDVVVRAHNSLDVVAVTASLGVSASGSSIAGQFSLQLVSNDVEARIGDGSTVTAGNNVAILGDDAVTVVAVTGGVALGGKNAFGVGFASTDIYDRKVHAYITDGASVTANSLGNARQVKDLPDGPLSVNGLAVKAVADDDVINVVVGASVSGSKLAVQGSILVDTNVTEVRARIGSGDGTATKHAVVDVNNGGDVDVDAHHDLVDVAVVGGVAAGFAGTAAGVTIHVGVHHRTVEATIGNYAQVTADGDIFADADLHAAVRSIIFAGAFSGASTAFSGALTVNVYNDFVTAQAKANSTVDAGGDVRIQADHNFGLTQLDATTSVSGQTGLSGSIGIVVQNATVKALVGKKATVTADDTVLVDAVGIAEIQNLAGGLAIGGAGGYGASGFVLVRNDQVRADIGDGATVTGRARGTGLLRTTYQDGLDVADELKHETVSGVAVIAESRESLVGIAIQGGVSASAAFAGSLPISAVTETTTARIGVGATINDAGPAGTPVARNDQDVIVRAVDKTLVVHVAGNVAVAGEAAVGAGFDVLSIVKNTHARIAARYGDTEEPDQEPAPTPITTVTDVNAKGNVIVTADAADKLVSVVLGIAGAANAAVTINANIYVHDSDTIARIGPLADVFAKGSVVVDAAQASDADLILISAAGSAGGSVNGGVGVAVFNRTTRAIHRPGCQGYGTRPQVGSQVDPYRAGDRDIRLGQRRQQHAECQPGRRNRR